MDLNHLGGHALGWWWGVVGMASVCFAGDTEGSQERVEKGRWGEGQEITRQDWHRELEQEDRG